MVKSKSSNKTHSKINNDREIYFNNALNSKRNKKSKFIKSPIIRKRKKGGFQLEVFRRMSATNAEEAC